MASDPPFSRPIEPGDAQTKKWRTPLCWTPLHRDGGSRVSSGRPRRRVRELIVTGRQPRLNILPIACCPARSSPG
jgi:hypothetical protein